MTPLQRLLHSYRTRSVTERDNGACFEELILCYLRNEATYRDLYSDVWPYADWAGREGFDKRNIGIDLVARTAGTNEFHAIQCKLKAENYTLHRQDIDGFFTASGKRPFTHRIVVSSTVLWSELAEEALRDQQPPVSRIDLFDLENSQIDWATYQPGVTPALKPKKALRDHQKKAVAEVLAGLRTADRGKLIMACGTGKTFTSLKIAEDLAGKGRRVLFLVPSLALLSQSLTEWTQESAVPLHSFAVCSDSKVGKKRNKGDDTARTFTHELRYPATTHASRLALEMAKRHDSQHMSVVFSTYHSIEVVSQAQTRYAMAEFDLIVCDEAHRTTGATFDREDESNFVRVHDNAYVRATTRVYMTATPRIYGEHAKASAEKDNVTLCSMDNDALYGKDLHVITFSEAVKRELLVDYKVIVLAVAEAHVNRRLQKLLSDENNQLKMDDAAKIVGCWKALSKEGLTGNLEGNEGAMQRAVAFCQVIGTGKGARTHKVSSKNIAALFQAVVEEYQRTAGDEGRDRLTCEAEHVDGGMNASEKEAKLAWLKSKPPAATCRILTNVRCLAEGVDVPALDAVLFLTPRDSQMDVVQSVGRVMRNAPGKKRGYVVLPVVIPAGLEPHAALNDKHTYKVVWQVLQALRSHDDRFDAMVNKLDLIGNDVDKMEVIAIADELQFERGEIERAIYSKLVQKVGNRGHWENWANDIAKIARTHISRITLLLEDPVRIRERKAFDQFAAELRDDLNDSIGNADIVEMLAQHLITKPVFDALFEHYSFASHNPMSKAMQAVLDVLQEHRLDKEAGTLQRFYDSVKMRATGIDNAAGKQKIVVELYEKFFSNAFPRMTDRLGIVYTPIQVVDFIIHSVEHILKTEFGQTLGSEGIHVIDPFTGTGTFITRLLQSGLIKRERLPHKYQHEIHANEIVLLAYYIAAINIEAAYHGIVGGTYTPFEGICLTDTFQMYEKDDLVDAQLVDNSKRRKRQKKLDVRVIMGNPPYSAGQESANDDAANFDYEHLDRSISATYVAGSLGKGGKRSAYDSYIRAIRWASNRIGQSGVIGFVTNAGFLESNSADGMRKCLAQEFSSIYVFHLRGNQRTSGELSRKEGGKVFGGGSRAPIAISLLVKNPNATQPGRIYFHDIGDYLSREEKLEKISSYASICGITAANEWQLITPNAHGDWLRQRDDGYSQFMLLGTKKKRAESKLFNAFSNGVVTNRDPWVYGFSYRRLSDTVKGMVAFYNREVERYTATGSTLKTSDEVQAFVKKDEAKISWGGGNWQSRFARRQVESFEPNKLRVALYRPFTRLWHYGGSTFNHSFYSMPQVFPDAASENIVIQINAKYSGVGQIALIGNAPPDLHCNGDSQCFPLYLYDDEVRRDTDTDADNDAASAAAAPGDLFHAEPAVVRKRRDGVTDEGLAHFQAAYPHEQIGKEDVFYYVYGLLHSSNYRERYVDNLGKELPRIPRVNSAADFWAFSKGGRALAQLHLNYETVSMYAGARIDTGSKPLTAADYRVEKMRYGKKGEDRDLTTVHYNNRITVTNIPLEAYAYVVNGKSAIDWVIERQCVKTDNDSGIVSDANDWAVETMDNPRYPLELLLRVVTVSMETMAIVKTLPPLGDLTS